MNSWVNRSVGRGAAFPDCIIGLEMIRKSGPKNARIFVIDWDSPHPNTLLHAELHDRCVRMNLE
ncbi:hypothetical protein [Paraburkholderia nodosa]|uniref:hypothetical protein n=1 Tax=Paraburkholderia nodosa TaxID=392320 RepID=UPI0004B0C04C|nr:hypothetical protein [Paraburkholderia nodosa]